jgi:hypothetical protein
MKFEPQKRCLRAEMRLIDPLVELEFMIVVTFFSNTG